MTTARPLPRPARGRASVVPVAEEFSADLLTPVSAYLRLAEDASRAFLFESVEGGERLGRYSFLGCHPFATVTLGPAGVEVQHHSGLRERLGGPPARAIGDYLGRYQSRPSPGLPPFTGGAVGYLGYEFARCLEELPAPAPRAAPHDGVLMLFRSVVAFDHVRRRVVLVHNQLLDEESEPAAGRRARRELARMRDRLSRPAAAERPLPLASAASAAPDLDDLGAFRAGMGPEAFARAVAVVKGHIRAGDVFQCVLSDEFRAPLRAHPLDVYRALRSTSPAPYLFYLQLGDETLLGASPEMLTRVQGGVIHTCPIAGTRPRGATVAADLALERQLRASVKERAEHLMLVDLGRNDVGRTAVPGSVKVPEFMAVHRFSHLMHLVSLVEGRLARGRSAWDALCACFPAGTLSGAPKIRAMEIIAGLEPRQRGPYGGAVVYADFSGSLDSCIAIRSLHVQGGVASLRAGAGLVADSQAAREYQEIRNKTRALRRAVAIAEGRA